MHQETSERQVRADRASPLDDQQKRHLAGPLPPVHRHEVGACELPIGRELEHRRCRNEAAATLVADRR
jgi:hypothetical protein